MDTPDGADETVGNETQLAIMEATNKRKSSMLKKTKSTEMLEAHAVEEDMLKELKFAKFIVKQPCLLCWMIIVLLLIIGYVDGLYFELSDQSNRTFLVEGNKYVDAYDAYELAAQFVADNSDENATVLPQTEVQDFWLYQIFFKLKTYKNDLDVNNPNATDYWILTPENIEKIIDYEDGIYRDEQWKNEFCYVGDDPLSTNFSCDTAINSAARIVAENYAYNYSAMTTEDIKTYIVDNIDTFSYFFNPYVEETGQTYIYRTFLKAGAPIATDWYTENGTTVHETDYVNVGDEQTEQETAYIDWATDYFIEVTVDNDGDLVDGDLEILAVSWIVYNDYFNVLLNEAMTYLVFAIIIVLVYMSIHLNSIFLSIVALFQILMSFPLAYFFYRLIYQIPHYDTLSSLIIFVLLGVGADDVFVFTDAWSQSVHFCGEFEEEPEAIRAVSNAINYKEKKQEYEIRRMSFAYRRAAKAMLVTQMTTFFAFLATATSSVMPISAFGIWAATIVAMNYFLVITLYPAVLLIHHKYIKRFESACLCFCCNMISAKKREKEKQRSNSEMIGNGGDDMPNGDVPPLSQQLSVEEQADEYRCMEKFLGTRFAPFIGKFRRFILVIFLVLFIVGGYLGAQMEAQSEDERWFADEHYMQQLVDLSQEFSAGESDNLVTLQLTWGIQGVDRDGTSKFEPDDYGVVEWDDGFDMSSYEAQIFLYAKCDEIRSLNMVYSYELVTCPMEDFVLYLDFIDESFPYVYDGDDMTQSAAFGSVFNDFLLDPIYGYSTSVSALAYADYDDDDEQYEVKFYSVFIYSRITWSEDSDTSRDERTLWDEYITDKLTDSSVCPEGICDSVENVALRWCWLVTQKAFVQSAIQGILIAMPLAFIILLISTHNWIVSIFAVLDIIGIMLCELSIMSLQGWKFGVSEAVAIVIIIGFSVDYVVHLANAYLESSAQGRMERLSFSLLTMGISVVSGAITTGCAGFFLTFPDIVFFKKMGILMVSTVAISIFWAMCFFTSIIAEWGPEGETGDLKRYLLICKQKMKGEYVAPVKEEKEKPKEPRKETYSEYNVTNDEVKPYTVQMETTQI